MGTLRFRSIVLVAVVQAAVAVYASFISLTALVICLLIGMAALGRYLALAAFSSSMTRKNDQLLRIIYLSLWIFAFLALFAILAAVIIKAKALIPYAVSAAFVGPVSLSLLALGAGIAGFVANRPGARTGHSGGVQ